MTGLIGFAITLSVIYRVVAAYGPWRKDGGFGARRPATAGHGAEPEAMSPARLRMLERARVPEPEPRSGPDPVEAGESDPRPRLDLSWGPDETAAWERRLAEWHRRNSPPEQPRGQNISESISVILRRQIPVRHDEPPRSWLGGLPMMPEAIEWPRGLNPESRDGVAEPLHFVAQIACADLSQELWAGLGPRTGWLLFFLNANSSTTDDKGLYRVIHTQELGKERRVPEDTGPVHDGVYTGSQFRHYMPQADVPPLWRRWPVDLVTVANQLRIVEGRSLAAPDDFAAILYPGQPIAEERGRTPSVEPFSWRCLGYGWRAVKAAAVAEISDSQLRNRKVLIDKFRAQGELPSIIAALDEELREIAGSPLGQRLDDPANWIDEERPHLSRLLSTRNDKTRRREEIAAVLEASAAVTTEYPNIDTLLTFLDTENERYERWRTATLDRSALLEAHFAATDPDTALDPEHFQDIRDALSADNCRYWALAYGRHPTVIIEQRMRSLWDWFDPAAKAASAEVAADYYVDSSRVHLLPAEACAALEPWWRQLYNNRPHRIGGYHDGLQSDAQEGPTDSPLLLQLATDIPMQWCWGDSGAIYHFIPTAALDAADFERADCQIECH